MKLFFLTVIPSPYQRQLFATIAKAPDLEVTVRYFAASAPDREWAQPKLDDHERIMEGRTLTRLGPSAHWNPGVMAEIEAARPDLVVVSDYSAPTAQFAMRTLARRGQPFVFWGEVPGFSRRGAVGTFLRRQLQAPLARATGIAGIGTVATEAYRQLFPGKPVFNIPYFCDLAPYRAARAKAERDKRHVDVLFSGQMIERKGVDLLIDAFARVAPQHPNLRLLLLGDGPERGRFEAQVPQALKDRVLFLGHREPVQLPEIFAAADIFCLPSRHDGWGVVVNEALGAGLPIVVTRTVGAGRDLVRNGDNGFVVPQNDRASLAKALDVLCADGALRAKMAKHSSDLSCHWDVDEAKRRWKAVSNEVVSTFCARVSETVL